jgi:hypothetical protein
LVRLSVEVRICEGQIANDDCGMGSVVFFQQFVASPFKDLIESLIVPRASLIVTTLAVENLVNHYRALEAQPPASRR